MKKFLALVMAMMMVLAMGTAFADGTAVQDTANSFTKNYDIINGTAPAETFAFNIAFQKFVNNEGEETATTTYPTVTLGKAVYASDVNADAKATVSVSIGDVTNAAIGVYTYEITEVAGNTAGVVYNDKPVYLVLTVLRDEESENHYVAAIHYETVTGEKTGEIENSYNAGNLTVTKQITGNMADMAKEFTFTIVVAPAVGEVFNNTTQVKIDNGSKVLNADGTITITVDLGDDESINITNIPVGATYTVSEEEDGYQKSHTTEADGSITGGDNDVDVWTNTLTSEVDTAINMDNAPYMMIMAMVVLAGVAMMMKKRAYND